MERESIYLWVILLAILVLSVSAMMKLIRMRDITENDFLIIYGAAFYEFVIITVMYALKLDVKYWIAVFSVFVLWIAQRIYKFSFHRTFFEDMRINTASKKIATEKKFDVSAMLVQDMIMKKHVNAIAGTMKRDFNGVSWIGLFLLNMSVHSYVMLYVVLKMME